MCKIFVTEQISTTFERLWILCESTPKVCSHSSVFEFCLLSVPRGTLVCIWEEFSRKGLLAPPYPPTPQV